MLYEKKKLFGSLEREGRRLAARASWRAPIWEIGRSLIVHATTPAPIKEKGRSFQNLQPMNFFPINFFTPSIDTESEKL